MNNYNENNEVWKDAIVIGYEGIYKISSKGRLKSKRGILKGSTNSDGYKYFTLSNHGKKIFKKAHRLVAEAFLPNTNCLKEVNHKDENKQNNNLENLEWCNHKYNCNYGTFIERTGKNLNTQKSNIKKRKPILGFSIEDPRKIIHFNSVFEANKSGFKSRNIRNVIHGYENQHYGYVWFYEKDFNLKKLEKKLKYFKNDVVIQCNLNGLPIKAYSNISEASKEMGCNYASIFRALSGEYKTCKGFIWKRN